MIYVIHDIIFLVNVLGSNVSNIVSRNKEVRYSSYRSKKKL